ncbi:hypothetical protein SASPL_140349 [Salvia splendens]|uniref:Methyltransferase n=1 Tax=Salvia splendens TaxID=180675 RepID=A0A8X8ZBV4_SALSN|nr:hypothetical protein SASPL_140349 [Salvia splendens]
MENGVPCYNVSANLLAGFKDGEEFDHVIWSGNVKLSKDQFLSSGSKMKRLMLLEENQITFHSNDGMTADDVRDYSNQIAKMIGLGSDNEFHQAGLWCASAFTLIDGCLYGGNFFSRQLPFPSLSYDMVHCAQCGIFWDDKDGMFLIEVDRVLKPGGYLVLTSPRSRGRRSSPGSKRGSASSPFEQFIKKLCWNLLSEQDGTFIWQKTTDSHCYASCKDLFPLCEREDGLSYYKPLVKCLSGTTSKHWTPLQNRSSASLDFQIHGIHPQEFSQDLEFWRSSLRNYWPLLSPLIFSDRYGGLNAALLEGGHSVRVMNVVPMGESSTLPFILDQGFAGVVHNWGEPFPTYSRTYDMLHAKGLLSHLVSDKCSITDLIFDMDRILRPEGWVVISDKIDLIEMAKTVAARLHWEARVIDVDNGTDQRLLLCQKPFFTN